MEKTNQDFKTALFQLDYIYNNIYKTEKIKCFYEKQEIQKIQRIKNKTTSGEHKAEKIKSDSEQLAIKQQIMRECSPFFNIVSDFYHEELMKNKTALNYLINKRKLSLETIKKFKLGYSNKDSTKLLNYLTKNNLNIKGYLRTYLLFENQKTHSLYDALCDCIVIPVIHNNNTYHFYKHNHNKEINKYNPKYKAQINFSKTDIFYICYGFSEAKNAILETKTAIIHEGFFDVISCHDKKIKNAVGLITITKLLSLYMINFLKKIT
ncbi:hypothetical protein CWO85_03010 [Candidatus Phytoplasma ziziphi]|uniref:DNA primase DNAG catalytic core N-terminal domain-containing protein n=1 Tax=Ziziphus jujuba witches'-broom phytoplasma TaxID=135727 RepID=A0A660HN22_ZIZJU|nr:hypothetical protein [Candidatus Phytoplasma ziziphi]AYJ01447.1 hypothetical protein CWO85_03010 [Candidatus Phytoplasma ziziphi]